MENTIAKTYTIGMGLAAIGLILSIITGNTLWAAFCGIIFGIGFAGLMLLKGGKDE